MFRVPFSADEFFAVFTAYNEFIWPAQVLLTSAAVGTIALTFRRSGAADRWVAGFLSILWLWTGSMYHMLHFQAINPAAAAFGILFVLQGFLFLWWGVMLNRLSFVPSATMRSVLAGVILVYALVIYPVLGSLTGHQYMASPTFGAPCPAVIYTFGVLLLSRRVPFWLVVVPTVWAFIGTSAVLAFGVVQDIGLLASAVVAIAMLSAERRRADRPLTHRPTTQGVQYWQR